MTRNIQPIYYHRRSTHKVCIGDGGVVVGGKSPVLVQTMTDTPTLDIEASAAQVLRLARAGAGLVRLTAQTAHHAAALGDIRQQLDLAGCHVPMCIKHQCPKIVSRQECLVDPLWYAIA